MHLLHLENMTWNNETR